MTNQSDQTDYELTYFSAFTISNSLTKPASSTPRKSFMLNDSRSSHRKYGDHHLWHEQHAVNFSEDGSPNWSSIFQPSFRNGSPAEHLKDGRDGVDVDNNIEDLIFYALLNCANTPYKNYEADENEQIGVGF